MHIQLARHSSCTRLTFDRSCPQIPSHLHLHKCAADTVGVAYEVCICTRVRYFGVQASIENSKAQSNRWLCECNLMNICVKRSLDYNNYHKKRKCFGEQLANVRAHNEWRIKILFINNFSGDSHVGYFTSQLNWLYFRKCEWGSRSLSIFLSFNSRAQQKPVMYLCIP